LTGIFLASAGYIGVQPYWKVPEYSGKIKQAKQMTVSMTDAKTPNADRILEIYLI
jgi:hypothetical protein